MLRSLVRPILESLVQPLSNPDPVACMETAYDGVDDYSILTIASVPTLIASLKTVCLEVNVGTSLTNGFLLSLSRQDTPTDGVNIAFLETSNHGIYIDYGGASRYLSDETTRDTWFKVVISINTTRDNSKFYLDGVEQTTTFGTDNTIVPRDGMCMASQFRNPEGNEGECIIRNVEGYDVIATNLNAWVPGDITSMGNLAGDLVFQSIDGSGKDNTVGATFTFVGNPVIQDCT